MLATLGLNGNWLQSRWHWSFIDLLTAGALPAVALYSGDVQVYLEQLNALVYPLSCWSIANSDLP
ncbi:MAG: hypothetical protein AAGA75_06810 [Cyanobacteria bacterium P01_E01_bin.6]